LSTPELLLIGAVVSVGILHTLVPDHWAPIAMVARARRWPRRRTARAAFIAGLGHTVTTLAIGLLVWAVGLAAVMRFGHGVSMLSGAALIGFGLWMAIASLREMHATEVHYRLYHREPNVRCTDEHDRPTARTALLLILGSSPMIEGIPAFFAAARFGAGLLAVMAVCFAASTIVTYVVVCVSSSATLERVAFGPLERYGETLSGAVIAIIGIVFLVFPLK
jgi:putative Mn2+ efflux pump MntP